MGDPLAGQALRDYRSKLHGKVRLTRSTWQHVMSAHGGIVSLNSDLIAPTLEEPDEVRRSQHADTPGTYIYYREPDSFCIKPGVKVPAHGRRMAVCIDTEAAQPPVVKTVYVTRKTIRGDVVYRRR